MKKMYENRGCFNEFLRKYLDNAERLQPLYKSSVVGWVDASIQPFLNLTIFKISDIIFIENEKRGEYMYQNELAFKNHENGWDVAKKLLDEHYVVLLSREENLLILNWEWSHLCDRNDVVFMDRCEFEEEYMTNEEPRQNRYYM